MRHAKYWIAALVTVGCVLALAVAVPAKRTAQHAGNETRATQAVQQASPADEHATWQRAEPKRASTAPVPFAPAQAPGPGGRIVLSVEDGKAYQEMSAVIEYFKNKPLPKHGAVHNVGDGVDSSARDAKLPADTSFARFRYEYEKHETPRLKEDLAWAEHELDRLTQATTQEERDQRGLFSRRKRAILSVLAERDRQEDIHDRYNRVDVVLKTPDGTHGV